MSEKVLLDTDIGSDIDDAVCLAYLLAQPGCDLLGITTVTGEGERRARMASALCQIFGFHVPIHVGAESPLIINQRQPQAPQAVKLNKWSHHTGFSRGEAVNFMRAVIRENPGEVTLLPIGPLTNIALLFKLDPEIPSLLKQLVLMCGNFENNRLEWNAMLDPHASAIVYAADVAIHRSIGTDVTMQVTMLAQDVRTRFQTPLLQPVLDFAEVWFQQTEILTFHDPLAATIIFDDKICGFKRGQVEVDLCDPDHLGKTRWDHDPNGPHEAALTVDADRFFEHFFGVFQ